MGADNIVMQGGVVRHIKKDSKYIVINNSKMLALKSRKEEYWLEIGGNIRGLRDNIRTN